jgi:hypothetical protein
MLSVTFAPIFTRPFSRKSSASGVMPSPSRALAFTSRRSVPLVVWILLGTAPTPGAREINHRAEEVARLFLSLYGREA